MIYFFYSSDSQFFSIFDFGKNLKKNMLQNKLIRLISTISRKEMTRFREMAASPFFNKHTDTLNLVQYLSEIYPSFDRDTCCRKKIFQQIYPAQAHDQSQLALIFTYTLRLFEKFLVQERFKERTPLHNILLLSDLRNRKHYNLYEKNLYRAEQELIKGEKRDSGYYNRRFQLAREADNYFKQIQKRQKDDSIEHKQKNLDLFYLSEKLKDACEMEVRRKILKVDYNTHLLEAVIQEVATNLPEYEGEPSIYMYYTLYQMIVHSDHLFYFEAYEVLKQNQQYFEQTELKSLYNYLQNYCIRQINLGEAHFLKEIFKLYQSQIGQGLLIEDGYLSEWHYKNIVTTGIRLGEMNWVQEFVESFKEQLHPESKENAYLFNLASYYYATKQLDKVLDLLVKVEYNDLRYNLGAKALLLRTYYDLEEYEALFSLAESFKQYLLRNKLMADSRRLGYANLFRLTRRTAQIKANTAFVSQDKTKKELKKLEKDVNEANTIFNKSWLEEKIKELADY